ncbi:urea ABC transporter ATP-binding subunit UrtE [Chamaesiphon sp. GL140_3_metabinner_50]|uniref:urea ABC transporter ATP-binding subunit UrtE n=1 Tax=Chamaesiphon sp. GL140_3_metabinner_50 TaxID=2970812 RepID=UPI0025E0B268|nr:urea ABC transporter ATP-binding subunit UrtE [Chamaesiphon sp. GL140_3_metabinner_50]
MLLEVNDVTVSYGQTPVLFGANLAVNQGEIACILGRNGVGKTTLLRSIIGLNKVLSGNIIFDIQNITRLPIFKRARAGIAYIPQGREIIPYLSVLDNLKLGLSAGKKKSSKIPHEIFEFFPMLKQHLNRQGGLLSGGQQQQLAIARGLMSDPKIMLLDEPTEGIQPSIVQEIEETLKRINREKGITLIVVEHKVDFVRQIAHKFFIMEKGVVVVDGETAELTDDLFHKYLAV